MRIITREKLQVVEFVPYISNNPKERIKERTRLMNGKVGVREAITIEGGFMIEREVIQ